VNQPKTIDRKLLNRVDTPSPMQGRLWAVVLAGGEGVRLRPLIRRVCGDERPKQYAPLIGSQSLLRRTLDRVALVVPPERTLVVTVRGHAKYIAEELHGPSAPHVLVQPENRGTAAGILFPAHWIQWRDPAATVAVFPSDHFVLEEEVFTGHVREIANAIRTRPEWIVLLGARPTEADTEYGWIEPGEPLGTSGGVPLYGVRRFWEKPSAETACACLAAGCLWNTLVFVAKIGRLVEAGGQCVPQLHARLAGIAPFAGTEDETWAIQQAYALARSANFSRAILESGLPRLAVSKLPRVTWSDWGTPERVLRTLRRLGPLPDWMAKLNLSA